MSRTGTAADAGGEVTKRALSIQCPTCGWEAGRGCLELATAEPREPHPARLEAANVLPPQADTIKAAVDRANNRAADAFLAWDRRDESSPTGAMSAGEFEAWLRSGEDAPGAVTPAKGTP